MTSRDHGDSAPPRPPLEETSGVPKNGEGADVAAAAVAPAFRAANADADLLNPDEHRQCLRVRQAIWEPRHRIPDSGNGLEEKRRRVEACDLRWRDEGEVDERRSENVEQNFLFRIC